MKRIFVLLLSIIFLGACTVKEETVSSTGFFSMDTYVSLLCYGNESQPAIEALKTEIHYLDNLFSAEKPASEIYKLNDHQQIRVSEETSALIDLSNTFHDLTDGAFNIAVRPLIALWGFNGDSPSVPSSESIHELLPVVSTVRLLGDGSIRYLDSKTSIDFGGIAKGYCGDRLSEILKKQGVKSALLSMGGNIIAYGAKPDGSDWNIAIMDPNDEESTVGIIKVSDRHVITSGSYQRYFTENGIQYHHILDPYTGWPASSGLKSVTVVSKSGAAADVLSTAFFILGMQKACTLASNLPAEYRPDGIIFIDENNTVSCFGDINFTPSGSTQVVYLKG